MKTYFQLTCLCYLTCSPHSLKAGSGHLFFLFRPWTEGPVRGSSLLKHTQPSAPVFTCQCRATCRLLSVLSFLIFNPEQTSWATSGLSGFTEGSARWLGPWNDLLWRRMETIIVWDQGLRGELSRPSGTLLASHQIPPFTNTNIACLVTHTWALSSLPQSGSHCRDTTGPAPILRGSETERMSKVNQPEGCAQDCFTSRRWASARPLKWQTTA